VAESAQSAAAAPSPPSPPDPDPDPDPDRDVAPMRPASRPDALAERLPLLAPLRWERVDRKDLALAEHSSDARRARGGVEGDEGDDEDDKDDKDLEEGGGEEGGGGPLGGSRSRQRASTRAA